MFMNIVLLMLTDTAMHDITIMSLLTDYSIIFHNLPKGSMLSKMGDLP